MGQHRKTKFHFGLPICVVNEWRLGRSLWQRNDLQENRYKDGSDHPQLLGSTVGQIDNPPFLECLHGKAVVDPHHYFAAILQIVDSYLGSEGKSKVGGC